MHDHMHLEIITTVDLPISANIKQLYIPTHQGETGIMENHRPYITLLEPGEIFYTDTVNKNHHHFHKDGFLEMNGNNIVIISDSFETEDSLVKNKENIEKQFSLLDAKIKSFDRIEEGMSQENIEKMPKELDNALREYSEYGMRLTIIRKIEKNEGK
jgi:F0F1-type ATP synthase epsilon subunit